MDATAGLLINAVISGLLLGGFYAAVSIGVAISFGMLDIVNIAHPAFILLGSYVAFIGNTVFGIDPILATVILLPAFYLLGMAAYQIYYVAFERRDDQSLRGLSFFFGILFIAEVALILVFGVDYRSVQAGYTQGNLDLYVIELPWRLLVPFLLGLVMVVGLQIFLSRTFIGRAIQAVAQDETALRLMGVSPTRIKSFAFGVATATASVAGSLLIIIEPVEPSVGREFIGRAFAAIVLGGMGSFWGVLFASIILGITESLVSDMWNPSWAPAIAFGFLLPTLAFRSGGLMGRRL